MSVIQRRNSQRLASTLEALSNDLDFQPTEVETAMDQNCCSDKWGQYTKGYSDQQAIQLLGEQDDCQNCDKGECAEEDESCVEPKAQSSQKEEIDQSFEKAFESAMAEEDDEDENKQSSIMQGDPGVAQVGSESTFDNSNVRDLGSEYGVDFDGDEALKDSIRNVPSKQARIKKLVARIQKVADVFERTGRKSLAYRLDVICNNLQAKYLKK